MNGFVKNRKDLQEKNQYGCSPLRSQINPWHKFGSQKKCETSV